MPVTSQTIYTASELNLIKESNYLLKECAAQTHVWKPGDYSIHLRAVGEFLPCTSSHRIKMNPLFVNLPYKDAFTLGVIKDQRLFPLLFRHDLENRDYPDIKGDPKDAFLSAQTHKIQGEKKTSIHGQILHQLSPTTGTTPDSERRPEALGRVYNTRTFVHVHCGMDQEIVGYPDFPVTEGNSEPLRVSDYPCEVTILAFGPLISLAIPIKHESSLASKVKMIVILGGAFFALGNINPPAEANIQHPLNLLFNLLSMKECRFHVLWVFPFLCRCIVTWKQLMFGFMSGVNITDITTQLKQTDDDLLALRDSKGNTQVQPDLFKYKKWVVWVGLREYASAIGSWIKPSR
ncbi:hypothetical protein F2Q70_00008327, partial [Brassica cretica]